MLQITSGIRTAFLGLMLASCGSDVSVPGDASTDGGETSAGETGDGGGTGSVCDAGQLVPCTCPGGEAGSAECLADGSGFGVCEGCDPGPTCGDATCDAAEDCASCAADCGECSCADAPSCDAALIPGADPMHVPELDVFEMTDTVSPGEGVAKRVRDGDPAARVLIAALADASPDEPAMVSRLRAELVRSPLLASRLRRGLARLGFDDLRSTLERWPTATGSPVRPPTTRGAPSSGPRACGDPQLRMRLASILVHQESDIILKDTIYCVIVSEAATGAEIRVTPPTPPMSGGDDYVYSLAEGVIWGQMDRLPAPEGNMIITYNCLEQDSVDGIMRLLEAIGDAAGGLGGIPGVNGWIFPTVGAVADIVAALLAFEEDDRLFNVSQIVTADQHMALTSGAWWSVRETGNFNLIDWDWELRVEAWGCAEAVP